MLLKLFRMLCALALLALPARAGAEVIGQGDFEFALDAAAFRQEDGKTRQDVYFRVSNASVRFKEMHGSLTSRIRVTIDIKDAAGAVAARDVKEYDIQAESPDEASSPLLYHTVTRRFQLAGGEYVLSCALEDLNAPKVSVVAVMRGELKASTVQRYPLDVPVFPADAMCLSDAKFLWSVQGDVAEPLYVPNPARLYGLHCDSLRVYIEAYVPAGDAQSQPLRFETEVINEKGEAMTGADVALPPRETAGTVATIPLVLSEDLNRFPAGTYSLYINGRVGDTLVLRKRAGSFNVAWDLRTWETTRHDFVAEAKFLLDPEDFDVFVKKDIGEQETLLKAMWKEIDPDPLTGVNEAYEKFLERLEYVKSKFADYQLGVFTDRGLVYLKYGAPDETIVDVIPLNRESISDALEKVRDKFHAVNFSNSGGRIGYAEPAKDIVVDPRRLGMVGEGGDTGSPYELWVYNGPGDPILERDRSLEPDIGMRFIFVDKEGYGRYRLESSSSMVNK